MASRPTKAFTSPDRQFGINAALVPPDEPQQTGGPIPYDPGDVSAPVPPDAEYRSHIAIATAVIRPADAPAAARPGEPEAGQLERTPGGGVNGLTPYARAGGNSYNAGGTGRSRTAPLPGRRK